MSTNTPPPIFTERTQITIEAGAIAVYEVHAGPVLRVIEITPDGQRRVIVERSTLAALQAAGLKDSE